MNPPKLFNKYETAFLLNELDLINKNIKTHNEAITYVSKVLRDKAIRDGYDIDDSYRSESGISSQFFSMGQVLDGKADTPVIFKTVVDIFLNNKEAFTELLQETNDYIQSQSKLTDSPAWLLTWNPKNWDWQDYREAVEFTSSGSIYDYQWACSSKKPQIGDKVFLIVLGMGNLNGIIASGYVTKENFLSEHWNEEKKNAGKMISRIGVGFDKIIDFEVEKSLNTARLKELFPNQNWSPQGSGISINPEYISQLCDIWYGKTEMDNKVLYRNTVNKSLFIDGLAIPLSYVNAIFKYLGIEKLDKGEKRSIKIAIKDTVYDANIRNSNLKDTDRKQIQIRYSYNSPIALAFKSIFKDSYRQLILDSSNSHENNDDLSEDLKSSEIIDGDSKNEYYEICTYSNNTLEFKCYPNSEPVSQEQTTREKLKAIKEYIRSKGYFYVDSLIDNFYLSLKSKPFVILAGTSGTGKTKIVELFAEAIGAVYKLVPVRPDWSDSSDLLGHVNLKNEFVPGAVFETIFNASQHTDVPYFLCLDEMNLARVEYYFSDFLSIIESRKRNTEGQINTRPLIGDNFYGKDQEALENYGFFGIPENLYLIGTVNMDETTFPFSKKVLDRANTIEFSEVSLNWPDSFNTDSKADPLKLDNSFLKTEYLQLKDCLAKEAIGKKVCEELEEINKILAEADAHVGYRVRDEIVFYLCNNDLDDGELLPYNNAMDLELMQKILPRINGSNSKLQSLLTKLHDICKDKYPLSEKKIDFMLRRFEEDGFTSYWL